MHYRDRKSNSDSSYDIVPVPVPVPPPRHPRAPTTIQILPEDFDAVTQDYETAPTEMFPYDGVTEVKSIKDQVEQYLEVEPRYSGVYGEWAERHEVHHHQAGMPSDFGNYMEEVTRRLQEVSVDDHGHFQDSTIRARGEIASRPISAARKAERGGKVNMWREEVARNEVGLGEFGDVVSLNSSPTRRSREGACTIDQGTVMAREVQDLKATLQRSQSSASQSYRSERLYTSTELNAHYPQKPQKTIVAKREKRAKDPSPTRSERIYTMAELNAGLTGKKLKNSPPRRSAFTGLETQYNRSGSSGSPPQYLRSKRRTSPPAQIGSRSASASSVEIVLASCQPSLLHIAPVLSSLGIRRDEHLRALARLREETRDREMKEEMLKQGVTVLEWAILMDKLRGL
ncbi:hypothetical protein BS17DRAFT_782775 [Gyrodon lividus]|nr:hypothetical protein BS17DRAFT_782775 [Gyrodon lividus]